MLLYNYERLLNMKEQIWSRVDKEIVKYIEQVKDKKDWTRSQTINIILQKALNLKIYLSE